MTDSNFYASDCAACGVHVPAKSGVYSYGAVFCTAPTLVLDYVADQYFEACQVDAERAAKYWASAEGQAAKAEAEAKRAARQERIRVANVQTVLELAAQANVRSLAQVITKVTGREIAVQELTLKESTQIVNDLHRRLRSKQSSDRRTLCERNNICPRCGGLGRADQWANTGSVCFDCGGDGKYHLRKAR